METKFYLYQVREYFAEKELDPAKIERSTTLIKACDLQEKLSQLFNNLETKDQLTEVVVHPQIILYHPLLEKTLKSLEKIRIQFPMLPVTIISDYGLHALALNTQNNFSDELSRQLKISRILEHQLLKYGSQSDEELALKLNEILLSNITYEKELKEKHQGNTSPLSEKNFVEQLKSQIPAHHPANQQKDVSSLFQFIDFKFLPINTPCYFSLYVKGPGERFYKILYPGDSLNAERIEKYAQFQLKGLYYYKEELSQYLSFCKSLQEQVIRKKRELNFLTISSEPLARTHLLHYGDQVIELFRKDGVTAETLIFAKQFLKVGLRVIDGLKGWAPEELKSYLDQCLESEHSIACTIIAGIFSFSLGHTSKHLQEEIALAALLHDVGVTTLPEKFHKIEDQKIEQMTQEDKILFESHPQLGFDLLEKIPGVSATVKQAVLCHHERKGGVGYPQKLTSEHISTLSEIIGLCEEYLDFNQSIGTEQRHQFKNYFEKELKFLFSTPLVDVFRKNMVNI